MMGSDMHIIRVAEIQKLPHLGQIIDSYFIFKIVHGRYTPDKYDLAHETGWEPYSLHDIGHVSWFGSVL